MKVYVLMEEDRFEDNMTVYGVFDEAGKKKKDREFLKAGCEYFKREMEKNKNRLSEAEKNFRDKKKAFDEIKASDSASDNAISKAKLEMLWAEESFETYKMKGGRCLLTPPEEDLISYGMAHPEGESFTYHKFWFYEYELNGAKEL